MLFRVELGAGLIKIRHDICWRELTCLYYHYETQPMPNPLSWYFHRLPKFLHRLSAIGSHFVQIIVPVFLFAPQPFASIAGGLIIFHQLWLVVSGNYSWLNWITIVLGITAFSDTVLYKFFPVFFHATLVAPQYFTYALILLLITTIILSIKPTLNIFSKNQLMNFNYNSLHLVNTYGAFGSVTKKRYEVVIEGTEDSIVTPKTRWKEYEFKGKPSDIKICPPQIAPYHLRLDWLMWFLPFSISITPSGITKHKEELWFLRLIRKLLENDEKTLKLFKCNPFEKEKPRFIEAQLYLYQFTSIEEKKATGACWKRTLIGQYLPPFSVKQISKLLEPYENY